MVRDEDFQEADMEPIPEEDEDMMFQSPKPTRKACPGSVKPIKTKSNFL